jgi:hypothetical protein
MKMIVMNLSIIGPHWNPEDRQGQCRDQRQQALIGSNSSQSSSS